MNLLTFASILEQEKNVFSNSDLNKVSAFGLGIERFCMKRHNITDIRRFYENDLRFLNQF